MHYAAWASDVEAPDREIAAAMAKAYTADAANYVTAECIQIHGGVGYTWECDAHVFLRRAKVNDLLLGYPELATRTRRRPLLRISLGRICPSVGPAAPGGVRRSSSPDAKRPTRLGRAGRPRRADALLATRHVLVGRGSGLRRARRRGGAVTPTSRRALLRLRGCPRADRGCRCRPLRRTARCRG